jgi:intracellular multiplication protein IcmL
MQSQNTQGETLGFLKDDFYRDGFRTILLSLVMIGGAIGLLVVISLYFFLHQVLPVNLPTYEDWRVQPEVPLQKPYIHQADLMQWVSTAIPDLFTTDFISYDQNLKNDYHYFTPAGWAKYIEVVNTYLNRDDVAKNKYFLMANANSAPTVLNQNVLEGKYAWWVQMLVELQYSDPENGSHNTKLDVRVLVVRVPTLNNLDGVLIENIIVAPLKNH